MYDLTDYLKKIDDVICQGPYQDTWESLSSYHVPEWYRKAKFGIFIHWGIYSVPAFSNEWYSRNMYIQGSPEYEHHIKTYGRHVDFGYKGFYPYVPRRTLSGGQMGGAFQAGRCKICGSCGGTP